LEAFCIFRTSIHDEFINVKIRAICTDVDGTLLDSRRALSSRTIAVISAIKRDVPVILASSRMPPAIRHLQKELGIADHPMICFNGGYVLYYAGDSSSPVILDSVQIPLPICTSIIGLTEGTNIHVSLYAGDEWYARSLDQWAQREENITKVSPAILALELVVDKWSTAKSGAHKVMCMGPELQIERLYAALQTMFSHEIHVYRSKSTYLEISPKVISKATALELVMRRRFNLDLSAVMAFGDNYNDIDMIRTAGLGIAVGNAIPEVKAVAKEVTLDGREDGVAAAIERYFF
jgi:Cof subfamily protein (haloacid dehalogenase superfamily)